MTPNLSAAKTLEDQATELADTACSIFLSEYSDTSASAQVLQEDWSHHFRQRILELSAALATGEAALFTARVQWSRRALHARLQDSLPIGATLRSLRAALESRLPRDIVTDALACIDEALRESATALPEDQVSQLDPGIGTQRLALLYLQSALEGNALQAMETVLDAIDDGLSHADAITKVLLAAQREIGHLWHIDHVTVAEEHLVTSTTQRLMAVIADRAPKAADLGKTAVAASIAGNIHDSGIRAIAYLMEMAGWRTIYLGSDVPRNDLPAAIHFYNADIALLSIALSSQLPKLRESIEAIRGASDSQVKIMVGGNAFNDAPDTWKALGADGYAENANAAIRLATELVTPLTHH